MKIIRLLIALATWIAFAVVLAYLGALHVLGEATWQTTVVLYLPHGLLLVPLVGLGLALAVFGPRKLLVVDGSAIAIVVFAIMELHLGHGRDPSGPHFRLMTYNVDSGQRSIPEMLAQIDEVKPDVLLLQESGAKVDDAVSAALSGWHFHRSGQFFMATSFPVVEVEAPKNITVDGKERSPKFMRYTLDTPLGRLDIFNVHPTSPRNGFEDIRGEGLSREIESGRVFAGDRHALLANTTLRRAQVGGVVAAIQGATHPFLVAGDTNLPHASAILADAFGGLTDAFAEAGSGFGYTFPAHKYLAWMRIDRIFSGPELHFTRAEVGMGHGSDHHSLFADIEKR